MPYTLDNFTRQASPALLAQAQLLVSAAAVTNLEKMDIEWLAEVLDNANHFDVAIAVGPHGELLSTCSCGDEANDLCRHAVAVLLTGAADSEARRKPRAKARTQAAKAPGKNTVEGRLRTLLEAAPPAAVIDLLVSLAKTDKHLQSRIYIELGDIGDSLDTYTAAVKAALSPRGGQSAWSDAHKANAAATQVDMLLQRAVVKSASGEVDIAVRMALVVFEHIQGILERVHSSRPIQACAERAMALMQQALPQVSAETRAALVKSLVRSVTQAHYIGTARMQSIKRMLVDLVSTPAERAMVEPLLAPPSYRYGVSMRGEIWEAAVNDDFLLRYALIARLDGAQAAQAFAQENSRFMAMRALLLEDALARNNLHTAYELASEGLRLSDKAYLHNVADVYVAQLVTIAEKRGETPSDLYLRQFQREPDHEHWLRYKQSIPAKTWVKERTRALRAPDLPTQTLYMIYSTEEMWDKLMGLLKSQYFDQGSAITELQGHGPALAAACPTELAAWCARVVDTAIKRYAGQRDGYRDTATVLRLLAGAGLGEQAAAIAARLRAEYPTRDALLESLAGL